jgi:hypothetical protein
MTTGLLAPDPCQSTFFIPSSNIPGNGVQVFTYLAGTTTKVTTYKDNAGAASHTNPIVLDSSGNLPSGSSLWLPANVSCKVVWAPAGDSDPPSSPYRTIDNMSGVPSAVSASTSQWVALSTPTFVNANAFRLGGDQTADVQVGRRIKTENTGGTVYSRVSSSTFGTSTTVGVINDSGSLDSGLSTAAYGLLSATNPSNPVLTDFYPLARSSTSANITLNAGLRGVTTSTTWNAQNTTGVVAFTQDFQYGNLTSSGAYLLYPPKHVAGLILSNSGATAVACTAGSTVNSSATQNLILSSAITKNPTSSWAESTGAGGLLDTGSMSSNIWYWGHLIKRTDGAWVDLGFSSSFSAPTLPSGYTLKSNLPIGAVRRAAASTTLFSSTELTGGGVKSLWLTPPVDVDVTQGSTSSFRTLSVPDSVKVLANIGIFITGNNDGVYVSSPDVDDLAVLTGGSLGTLYIGSGAPVSVVAQANVMTNTSSQVRTRALASTTMRINTFGYEWSRK